MSCAVVKTESKHQAIFPPGIVLPPKTNTLAEGGELNVNLQKVRKADTWTGALQGHNASVDPVTLEGMQKKIMLERFQNEVRGASCLCVYCSGKSELSYVWG